ncbi:hypothetical protein TVAG_368270 [Trichomonas vaginalis G3]|uniref:Uncharacterized protein n=1 Tax=Trichomonas vaginalis (strain ATCC PRA-98 / G3) TaxID=412133 RepID=A2FI40_TRIV3|nr:hypothetical protein TVAGG3_0365120 [Trichomonas vaginalis G3]EAX95427.1 hypothetical protein TVAG_368270 [Trichomonas vaginalis G3]KAI5532208.1 hypothetical protein TVAGG3_0365120 [Trichomonas vaginalis G3]|eukprot:XP_001308357.1 hypothetical protein [Trichomonas vaginalis G3]
MEKSESFNGLYYHAVAEKLAQNFSNNKKFRKPMDAEAYRIANEYAIEYLGNHSMSLTEEIAVSESNQYILERHNPNWVARKLKLNPTEPLFPQLVKVLGADQPATVSDTFSDSEEPQPLRNSINVSERGLPKVPEEVKGKNNGRRNLMSDDEDVFTAVMNTTYAEENLGEPKEKKHHHQPEFTALADEEAKENKPSRLYNKKEKRGKKEKLAPPPKDYRAHDMTDTIIDTQ